MTGHVARKRFGGPEAEVIVHDSDSDESRGVGECAHHVHRGASQRDSRAAECAAALLLAQTRPSSSTSRKRAVTTQLSRLGGPYAALCRGGPFTLWLRYPEWDSAVLAETVQYFTDEEDRKTSHNTSTSVVDEDNKPQQQRHHPDKDQASSVLRATCCALSPAERAALSLLDLCSSDVDTPMSSGDVAGISFERDAIWTAESDGLVGAAAAEVAEGRAEAKEWPVSSRSTHMHQQECSLEHTPRQDSGANTDAMSSFSAFSIYKDDVHSKEEGVNAVTPVSYTEDSRGSEPSYSSMAASVGGSSDCAAGLPDAKNDGNVSLTRRGEAVVTRRECAMQHHWTQSPRRQFYTVLHHT